MLQCKTILLQASSLNVNVDDIKGALAQYAKWYVIGEEIFEAGSVFKCIANSGSNPSRWTNLVKSSKFQVTKSLDPEIDMQKIQKMTNFENNAHQRPVFNKRLRANKKLKQNSEGDEGVEHRKKPSTEVEEESEDDQLDEEIKSKKINEVTHADQWLEVVKYTSLVASVLRTCGAFSSQLVQISNVISTQFSQCTLFPRAATLHQFNIELQKNIDMDRLKQEVSGVVRRSQRCDLFNKSILKSKLIEKLKESVSKLNGRVSFLEKELAWTEAQLRPSYAPQQSIKKLKLDSESELIIEKVVPKESHLGYSEAEPDVEEIEKQKESSPSIAIKIAKLRPEQTKTIHEFDRLSSGQKRLFADQIYRILSANKQLFADYEKIKHDTWEDRVPEQLRKSCFSLCKNEDTGKCRIEMTESQRLKINAQKLGAPTYEFNRNLMSHPENGYRKKGETLWDFVEGLIEDNSDLYQAAWDLLKTTHSHLLWQFLPKGNQIDDSADTY